MLSFHNDPALKEEYEARVLRHQELDEIVQHVGYETNGKTRGCAVGCTLNRYDHHGYETELGLPEWLARLEDVIHEGLSLPQAKLWPAAFLAAIPVGVDLALVKWRFGAFLMRDSAYSAYSARSAAYSACSAAYSADSGYSAARSAAYVSCRDELLRLLREAA